MDNVRDRLEILEVLSRHQIYIDLQDAERYAALYADDGRYESPFGRAQGTADIRAMFEGLRKSGFTTGKRHFNGPIMIDVDGDDATALSYWWVSEAGQPPTVYATGTYRDELRRVDGRWRITSRIQAVDSAASVKQ